MLQSGFVMPNHLTVALFVTALSVAPFASSIPCLHTCKASHETSAPRRLGRKTVILFSKNRRNRRSRNRPKPETFAFRCEQDNTIRIENNRKNTENTVWPVIALKLQQIKNSNRIAFASSQLITAGQKQARKSGKSDSLIR
ncbi:exported protein of unknown function [Pseudorhizobium banfieldiae]|uniref:Secreted protein n=1 Tax=Pseudorhizobium banfieldiae TaxID=1125847 RepID=L0NDN0_9HYPH|nr:exported protein of unknown function [Pseudorhizobium banfieldiae]